MVQVERRPKVVSAAGPAHMRRGTLFLVDLAGSERVKKSGAMGTQFTELKAINLSLAALGNCIAALAERRSHVPYRDSKLTRLLQNSLGGNAMTALVITVASEGVHAHESLSTLQFGSRAKLIPVKASVNEVVDYKSLYEALQAKMDSGDDANTALSIEKQQLEAKLAALQKQHDATLRVGDAGTWAFCWTNGR
jgi:kinesin family member 5